MRYIWARPVSSWSINVSVRSFLSNPRSAPSSSIQSRALCTLSWKPRTIPRHTSPAVALARFCQPNTRNKSIQTRSTCPVIEMEQVNTTDRLSALRALMKERNVDIYGANMPLTLLLTLTSPRPTPSQPRNTTITTITAADTSTSCAIRGQPLLGIHRRL